MCFEKSIAEEQKIVAEKQGEIWEWISFLDWKNL